MTTNPIFAGIPIIVSEFCPEFSPNIQMRECGCSSQVLAEFNAWLLDKFGSHRHVYRFGESIVMHPRTLHALRQKIGMKGLAL